MRIYFSLLLFFLKESTEAATASTYFHVNNDTHCTKGDFTDPWTDHNEISCLKECLTQFKDQCKNAIFNPDNKTCIPVHPTSRDAPMPSSQPGDVLYSQYDGGALNCNTAAGFQRYEACGAAACLRDSLSSMTYFNAKTECESINATMFSPNSPERFALLEAAIDENPAFHTLIWVGLNKFTGTWAWETGEDMDSDTHAVVWASGQPDNDFSKTCAFYQQFTFQKIHNAQCSNFNIFFCEQAY
ncbi:hypothetical protein ElyMa_004096400 [Elysia marginata]|uniref:C-type lectin domain-containing protein n=1 Tax=Elysia marginata TaxID=1093978 RepID=A0AAV4GBN5_9GAST|nr:hypothetical protein ElyMa_004096400 [Elysia marginata]